MIRGAGVLYIADGRALFLKRSATGDHGGEWCLPGGGVDGDETSEQAARREFEEETGRRLDGELKLLTRRIKYDPSAPTPVVAPVGAVPVVEAPPIAASPTPEGAPVDFTTFVTTGPAFEPKLNAEHVGVAWAPLNSPPEPLHPGCRVSLQKVTAHELDIARLMSVGDLVSPQKYQNVWLFDLRISGTGVAYRPKIGEYVLRKPEGYLTTDFLARCNGLPILWQHPPTDILTSDEFSKRVIGTMFLPYIRGDEVWGVAKIYNEEAAQRMQDEQLSTSPGVMAAVMLKGTIEIDNGESTLVVEGAPALADHLAICTVGVWDKGQEPQGVRAEAKGDSVMAEDKKTDAGNQGELLDKVLAGIDSLRSDMSTRMDAMESEMKADKKRRDDAEEKKKTDAARADAVARRDAFKFSSRKDGEKDEDYAKRHDAEEEDMKKACTAAGEAEELAADKAKKARKDSEDEEDKERKAKADTAGAAAPGPKEAVPATNTKADSANNEMTERLARVEAALKDGLPMQASHADHAKFADAQARADEAYQAFGKQAPGPMQAETIVAYCRRLLTPLQKYSLRWKDTDLVKIATDSAAFAVVQNDIYTDSIAAAARPSDLGEGELRMVEKRHPVTKLPIYEFVSSGGTFIGGMKPLAQAGRLNASPRGATH